MRRKRISLALTTVLTVCLLQLASAMPQTTVPAAAKLPFGLVR